MSLQLFNPPLKSLPAITHLKLLTGSEVSHFPYRENIPKLSNPTYTMNTFAVSGWGI